LPSAWSKLGLGHRCTRNLEDPEVTKLEQSYFVNLRKSSYFTHITIDGKPFKVDSVKDFSASIQVVSFGLIALLGLGILIKNGWTIRTRIKARSVQAPSRREEKTRGLLPWAMAVGLVPCPGVVMVMLFCLSMGP